MIHCKHPVGSVLLAQKQCGKDQSKKEITKNILKKNTHDSSNYQNCVMNWLSLSNPTLAENEIYQNNDRKNTHVLTSINELIVYIENIHPRKYKVKYWLTTSPGLSAKPPSLSWQANMNFIIDFWKKMIKSIEWIVKVCQYAINTWYVKFLVTRF